MHRPLALTLLILLRASVPAAAHDDGPHAQGLVEKTSPYPVAETMDRLEAVVRARGFKVFARIDHGAGAASVDMELRPTELLIFGNPAGGAPLMQNAQTIAIDLPLKALIYEDTEGVVRIAFNDPAFLVERHGLASGAAIAERMTGLIESLAAAALGVD